MGHALVICSLAGSLAIGDAGDDDSHADNVFYHAKKGHRFWLWYV